MPVSLALFAVWLVVRPTTLDAGGMELHLDVARVRELWPLLWSGFQGPREMELAGTFAWVAGIVGGASLIAAIVERQLGGVKEQEDRFKVGAWMVVAACTAVFFGLFLTLPMQIGAWCLAYAETKDEGYYQSARKAMDAMFLFFDVPGESFAAKGMNRGFITRSLVRDDEGALFEEKASQSNWHLQEFGDHSYYWKDDTSSDEYAGCDLRPLVSCTER